MNVLTMPTIGMAGFVERWEVVNKDGSIARACYVPQKNMILNAGLDLFPLINTNHIYSPGALSDHAYLYYFCIGTGTALPNYTDTTLGDEKYRGACQYSAWYANTASANGASPYYMWYQRGVETPMGALDSSVDGEYAEIGFADYTTGALFSKFRIVDELGNPTTVYISSTQQLRLKYILRFQLTPDTATHYTATITGLGSVGYTAVWQDTGVTYMSAIGTTREAVANHLHAISGAMTLNQIGVSPTIVGGSTAYETATVTPYVNGTYYRDNVFLFGVNDAVFTITGFFLLVSTIQYNNPTQGYAVWALNLDTPVAKPNTHALSLTLRFPWARA